jgi:hypothetical protein
MHPELIFEVVQRDRQLLSRRRLVDRARPRRAVPRGDEPR